MSDPRVRRGGALIAALVGGYLMHLALDPASGAGTAFWSFAAGLALWVVVGAVLVRFYRPGTDQPSADEIGGAPEWRVARFLRRGRDAAPLYLGLRLFLGYEWITGGWGKLTDPGWFQTGASLRAFWERAAAVPQQGRP